MIEFNDMVNESRQNSVDTEESGFDFLAFGSLVLSKWYWVAASVVVCLCLAWAYLHFKHPTYMSETKVLIRDNDRRQNTRAEMSKMQMMGLSTNTDGFDNELETILSKSMAVRTVRALKLYTSYYVEGRLRRQDIYRRSPIRVFLDRETEERLDEPVHIKVTPNGKAYKVEWKVGFNAEEAELHTKTVSSFPDSIVTGYGTMRLMAIPTDTLTRELFVDVNPVSVVANSYYARTKASPTSKTTTVALIRFVDGNRQRALDYLQGLVDNYNLSANEEKNETAILSDEFINRRIQIIQGELDLTETDLQSFKENNKIINLKNDAALALTQSSQFQDRQVEAQTEIVILEALIEYIRDKNNEYRVLPSNVGLSSRDANDMMKQYNDLILKRQRLLHGSNESQPMVRDLTLQIENMRGAVEQMLVAQRSAMEIQKKSIDKQYARYSGQVTSTPGQERTINNLLRQQEVKAGLYLKLLERREENAISLASTVAKARIIEDVEIAGKVSPNNKMVWLLALLLGFFLPIGIIYLLELLRYKIEDQYDVAALSRLPILATLPTSRALKASKERALVVSENTNDMMDEAFRGLRTNLKFVMNADKGENVLMVTSVIPGEGKTFVSTNLAMSYALLGKRVIVVGLDVRKPRLSNLFGLHDRQRGITEFLITDGDDTSILEKQIFHGVGNENLDVLPAGTIPPNPGELVGQDSLAKAIKYLSGKYDVVILDTPPMGLVSDALDIARWAHATVVVCRCDVSARSSITWIDQLSHENKVPHACFVVNGINYNRGRYYHSYKHGRYGNYGNYGTYGNYGEEAEKKKKSLWRKK